MLEILAERDVQDRALAHRVVEADLDEKRGLADAGTRHDDAEVTGAQTSLGRALEDPERAFGR